MACYDTLGPDPISLICSGNVLYVHWLRQVLFPEFRLHVWTFSLSVETHRYIHKRTFNFYDCVDCKYAQTSTLLFCRKPLSWDY